MADMISATVMINTDFPRRSSSLQMAAAVILPVPGLPLKDKAGDVAVEFVHVLPGGGGAFICPLVSIL